MNKNITAIFKYLLAACAGLALMFLCSRLQHKPPAHPGEYYYSDLLRNNYTILAAGLLFIAGMISGYFLKLNPWLTGISLIAVFPVVALYEATVYRGSHNLIPFELAIYFLFALPGIAGTYLGKVLFDRRRKQQTG